jgi:hypothetical protein
MVLLLSMSYLALNHDVSAHLLSALQSSTFLLQAESEDTARQFLSKPELKAVIIGDADLAEFANKYLDLHRRIFQFAEAGGIVVLGCSFSSMISRDHANRFFKDTWKLPWKMASYQRSTYFANPSRGNGLGGKEIPRSYSQKAVSLKSVADEDKVYIPTPESSLESLVFPPVSIELGETPVAYTKVGEGFLGYVGDVNSEEGSTSVILAMLNLA